MGGSYCMAPCSNPGRIRPTGPAKGRLDENTSIFDDQTPLIISRESVSSARWRFKGNYRIMRADVYVFDGTESLIR